MAFRDDPPLHDFPDRALRELLTDPGNLRDLIGALLPDCVDRLDFSRWEILPRTFLIDDWRRRESDLLVRLPWFPEEGETAPLLICLLIEQQSEPEAPMPLRTLLYTVLYWQSQWHEWEQGHARGEGLRLTPVVPIVRYTGNRPWRTHRTLGSLIEEPEALARCAPPWEPLFWELTEHPSEELLGSVGEFHVALAVVREERASSPAFREVFTAALCQEARGTGPSALLMMRRRDGSAWRSRRHERPHPSARSVGCPA